MSANDLVKRESTIFMSLEHCILAYHTFWYIHVCTSTNKDKTH